MDYCITLKLSKMLYKVNKELVTTTFKPHILLGHYQNNPMTFQIGIGMLMVYMYIHKLYILNIAVVIFLLGITPFLTYYAVKEPLTRPVLRDGWFAVTAAIIVGWSVFVTKIFSKKYSKDSENYLKFCYQPLLSDFANFYSLRKIYSCILFKVKTNF